MAGTWTSSEDEDFGSLGDNKVIVTGGTSGTPAQFSDFVTADRAGEAALLAATAGLSPTLALSFALRPVDVIALLISFIVASKTTETDHIFITGTDWRGAAQTEGIDVSAGNATYVSTKYFATISNIDCSDNAAGGGTQWADGTVRVTQPQWGFIWNNGHGQYIIDAKTFAIGDGSTSTYFQSRTENAYFPNYSDESDLVLASATLHLGILDDVEETRDGSVWNFKRDAGTFKGLRFLGILKLYGSQIIQPDSYSGGAQPFFFWLVNSSSDIQNSILEGIGVLMDGNNPTIRNSIIYASGGSSNGWQDVGSSATFINNRVYSTARGITFSFQHGAKVIGATISNIATSTILLSTISNDVFLIDSTYDKPIVVAWQIPTNSADFHEQQTVNIHVADKDGSDLQSVVVLCEDQTGAQVFSVSTDSNGDITEQTISWRKFTDGSPPTTTTFSPHKFTFSLAGYETQVHDKIILDSPIGKGNPWNIELQPLRARVYGRSHRIQTPQFA